jgi:hypothetical protein
VEVCGCLPCWRKILGGWLDSSFLLESMVVVAIVGWNEQSGEALCREKGASERAKTEDGKSDESRMMCFD